MDELKWITQFSQLTASSILAAVLGWLLYHMPKHFAAERKSREVAASSHSRAIDAVLAEAKEQQKFEREMCERHHREAMDAQERRHREAMEGQEARHRELISVSESRYRDLASKIDASHTQMVNSHDLLREGIHTINNFVHNETYRRAADELKYRRGQKPSPPHPQSPKTGAAGSEEA